MPQVGWAWFASLGGILSLVSLVLFWWHAGLVWACSAHSGLCAPNPRGADLTQLAELRDSVRALGEGSNLGSRLSSAADKGSRLGKGSA